MTPKFSYILIALLAIGGGGYIYWDNTKPVPAPQAADSTAALPMVDVKVPTLTGAAIIGETIFNAKCAACHGANAAGQDGVAPPLVHRIYEPGHHGDGAFLLAAQSGVRAHHWQFGNMPPVEGVTQGDVKNIIAYVRALQKENGIF